MQKTESKVILISSIPLSGHAIPVLRIGAQLRKRGHRVVFASSNSYMPLVNRMFPTIQARGIADKTDEFFSQPIYSLNEYASHGLVEEWTPTLRQLFAELKPDAVLVDILALAPAEIAHQLNIPVCVNFSLPLRVAKTILVLDTTNNLNFCGFTLLPPNIHNLMFGLLYPKLVGCFRKSSQRGILTINTFLGIQKPTMLPPNIFLTGPLERHQNRSDFEFEPELKQWLDEMKSLDKTVIYMSMGSIVKPQPNFIKAIYQGLKASGYAVAWSLREGVLPEQNPLFFVRKWLPQAQLISLPQTKAVITHCGWGGMMQCVSAGKPMLGIPCFGDQYENAIDIQKLGIGRILQIDKPAFVNFKISTTLDMVKFTPQKLCQLITQICQRPSYAQNMKKIMLISKKTRGAELAAQQIQSLTVLGAEHIVDPVQRKTHEASFRKIFLQAGLLTLAWMAWKNRSHIVSWVKSAVSQIS